MATGDVAGAWSECEVVVEGRCEIGSQEHLYLETQRARAVPGEDGAMQVFSATQGPAAVQHVTAAVLGGPMDKIEVDVKRLGGGFGGKEDQATHWAAMAALAAAHLDAPVELVLNRLDDIRMTGKRHPYSADFRIGLTANGKILAYEATFFQNSGAFADLSPPVLARTLFHATNAYFIPNVRVTGAPCRTNLQPHTAFGGFGGPQGMYAGDVRDLGRARGGVRGRRNPSPSVCVQSCQLRGQEGLRPDAGLLRHLTAAGARREHQHHAGRQHVTERRQRHHRPERQRGDHRRRDHPRRACARSRPQHWKQRIRARSPSPMNRSAWRASLPA